MLRVYFFKDQNKPYYLDNTIIPLIEKKVELIKDSDLQIIGKGNLDEIYLNYAKARQISFFTNDIVKFYTFIIIPYSNHIYSILYKDGNNNSSNDIRKIIANCFGCDE